MTEFRNMLVSAIVLFIMLYFLTSVVPDMRLNIGSPTGNFLANSNNRHMNTILAEEKWVSSTLFVLAKTEGTIKDEFGGEQKGLILPFSGKTSGFDRMLLDLTIRRAGSGTVTASINGEELYREQAEAGKAQIFFDRELLSGEDMLEVKASRGMDFWSSASCDVKAEVKGEVYHTLNTTFLVPQKYSRAVLIASFQSNDGKLIILVNGQNVYEGEPENTLDLELTGLKQANRIEFLPATGASHYVNWAEVRFE